MIKSGVLVAEDEALRAAGANIEIVQAGPVTYARGSDALVIVVPAGENPGGSRLVGRREVELREPFPSPVAGWLDRPDRPWLGFVRGADGLYTLGRLRQVRTHGANLLERAMGRIPASELVLHEVGLELAKPLPVAVLDRLCPLPTRPVPGIDWLTHLPADRVTAMRAFLLDWYADVAAAEPDPLDSPVRLPPPLAAFYELAASRPEIYGAHNTVYPPDELEHDDNEGGVIFAADGHGVWVKVFNPTDDDPKVYDDGEPDGEPLSGVLLQLSLIEAAMSAPYAGQADITPAQRTRFLAAFIEVPLAPASFPERNTTIHVAPGLVAITHPHENRFLLTVGSREGAELRKLRKPGFRWNAFNA